MKKNIYFTFLIVSTIVFQHLGAQESKKWVLGYLPTYHQGGNGNVGALNDFDFARLTHIGHHGPYLHADGSLDYDANACTTQRMAGAVLASHARNKPILLSIVSWVSYMEALGTPAKRTVCINELLHLIDTYGYDGIDVDLEPVMSPYVAGMQTDNPVYFAFVNQLFDSLSVRHNAMLNRQPLLTAAVNSYGAFILKKLESKFDMMNIMTYDMTNGWVDYNNFTWHDSPVYDYNSNGWPSVHNMVQEMLRGGIAASKIGIGISFDAFRWQGGSGTATGGVTAPAQTYTTKPSWTRFSYEDMMDNIFNSAYYHWDNVAKMSYLSINNATNANDQFWSYNDEASCQAKAEYVLNNNLGGVIIWELYLGLRGSFPAENHIPQLKATWDALSASSIAINNDKNVKVQVSPNPIQNNFTVQFNKPIDKNLMIELFDFTGREILIKSTLSSNPTVVEIFIPNLISNGIYILKYRNKTEIGSEKLIKLGE